MSDKSPPITQPQGKCECVVLLYISLSCTCIHIYILVSTLVTPDFFSRFFVCYSAIFVLFKRGLIVSSRQSTRVLTYNVCCDQLVRPEEGERERRRKKEKKIERIKPLHYFPFPLILPPIISRNSPLSLSYPPLSLGPRTYFPPKTQNPSGCA